MFEKKHHQFLQKQKIKQTKIADKVAEKRLAQAINQDSREVERVVAKIIKKHY